jgi:predicted Rossmann-fold nucleotide-binding protein
MKPKIGIFGSAAGDLTNIIPIARELGDCLSKQDVVLITGACNGLPYEVVSTAAQKGSEIWGFSQSANKADQEKTVHHDTEIYTKLFYVPKDYAFINDLFVSRKYRNVSSTAHCDAGIIISGRWGSLNEFTNLYDMGKVIGVLTGTGGVADELETLNKKIHKPGKAIVIFDKDPNKLVEEILEQIEERKKT